MLRIFFKEDKKVRCKKIANNIKGENGTSSLKIAAPFWIDAINPTKEHLSFLEKNFAIKLPSKVETSLEGSARNYIDKKGLHLHLYFLRKKRLALSLSSVSFLLKDTILFSLRDKEATVLRLINMKLKSSAKENSGINNLYFIDSGEDLLLRILEENIDFFADKLEDLYEELNDASARILQNSDQDLNFVLKVVTKIEDANSKIRLCLLDAQRGLSFLQRNLSGVGDNLAKNATIQEINRDIDSLLSHTNFVFEKLNFLLNSAQGFININQNKIIKIFSIMSLMFMPPTLIASIYGMNFEFMPELSSKFAYPLVIIAMFISAFVPYRWFKNKNWL